jgi:hypothetical protein
MKVFCIRVDSDGYEIGLGGGAEKVREVYATLDHGFLQ